VGSLKTVIDELAKHTLLIYFIILWGASMFLYAVCNLGSWGFGIADFYDVLWILANLIDLFAGVFLIIFGVKLLNADFLSGLQIGTTLVYFLLLWAGQFFFWGLYDLLYFEGIICLLAALVHLFAGIILALFAWNLLGEKEAPPE
jgi:hypothetical protein